MLGESKLLAIGGVVATRQDNDDKNLVFFNLNNQSINNNINIYNNFNDAYDNNKSDVDCDGKSRVEMDKDGCDLVKDNDQSKDFDII